MGASSLVSGATLVFRTILEVSAAGTLRRELFGQATSDTTRTRTRTTLGAVGFVSLSSAHHVEHGLRVLPCSESSNSSAIGERRMRSRTRAEHCDSRDSMAL